MWPRKPFLQLPCGNNVFHDDNNNNDGGGGNDDSDNDNNDGDYFATSLVAKHLCFKAIKSSPSDHVHTNGGSSSNWTW